MSSKTKENIDHNPSSTTATESFHGTGISLMQHLRPDSLGTERNIPTIAKDAQKTKKISDLPVSYTNVLPFVLKSKDQFVSPSTEPVSIDNSSMDE